MEPDLLERYAGSGHLEDPPGLPPAGAEQLAEQPGVAREAWPKPIRCVARISGEAFESETRGASGCAPRARRRVWTARGSLKRSRLREIPERGRPLALSGSSDSLLILATSFPARSPLYPSSNGSMVKASPHPSSALKAMRGYTWTHVSEFRD